MKKIYLNITIILIAFLAFGFFIYSRVKDASTIIEARKYQNNGNYEKSAELYLKALKETPNNFNFYRELAIIYRHTGEQIKLKQIFNDGLKVNPDDKYFLVNAGWMNFKDKKYAEAEKQFEKVFNKDKKNANIAFMYARTLQEEGKFREALEIFQIALKNGFDKKRCHLNIASIYECGFNDYKKALEYYNLYLEEATDKDKKIVDKIKDFTQWNIGEKLEQEGKYAEAIEEYNKQLKGGNTSIAVYSRLGRAYRKNCDFLTGESIYVKALGKYENNYYILNNLGSLYFKIERYKDALSCWFDAIKKDPEKPNAYYNLGTLNTKLGNFDKAEEYYLKALQKGYDRADVYIQLYQMATKYMKNRDKAVEYAYIVREYPQYINALLPIDRTEPRKTEETISEKETKKEDIKSENNIEQQTKEKQKQTEIKTENENKEESKKEDIKSEKVEQQTKEEQKQTEIKTENENKEESKKEDIKSEKIEQQTKEEQKQPEIKTENTLPETKETVKENKEPEKEKINQITEENKKEEIKQDIKQKDNKKEEQKNTKEKIDSDNEIPAFSAPPI